MSPTARIATFDTPPLIWTSHNSKMHHGKNAGRNWDPNTHRPQPQAWGHALRTKESGAATATSTCTHTHTQPLQFPSAKAPRPQPPHLSSSETLPRLRPASGTPQPLPASTTQAGGNQHPRHRLFLCIRTCPGKILPRPPQNHWAASRLAPTRPNSLRLQTENFSPAYHWFLHVSAKEILTGKEKRKKQKMRICGVKL